MPGKKDESGLNLRERVQPSQAAGAATEGAASLLRAWKAKCSTLSSTGDRRCLASSS